ncbi:MAG: helix-turn-helix domain-containing protein [Methylocystaceae bacterium]|nr:helix-turn-helix domain-containing protein [Methylocystaceae bacterium]
MFGHQIRNHRKRSLLTQAQLAERAGLTIDAVRNVERGQGTVQTLETILRCLHIQLSGLPRASSIGGQIKRLRSRHGHSQRRMAERCGLSQPTIIRLERGQGRISSLHAIAERYNIKLFVRDHKRSHFQKGDTDAWNTSAEFLKLIHQVVPEFCIDVASNQNSLVNARSHFYESHDGLAQEWKGQYIWLNGPYSTISDWIDRADTEYKNGNAKTIIALLPSRTNTGYFHDKIAGKADIIFIKKRLKFGTSSQQAPFPSMLAIWGGSHIIDDLLKLIPGTHLPASA